MGRILVCSLLFCLAYAEDNNTTPVFKYITNNETVEDCKDCLAKCCPENQIILQNGDNMSCVEYNFTRVEDFQMDIFNENIEQKIIKTEKTLKSFKFMYGDVFWGKSTFPFQSQPTMALYLLENGDLAMRRVNYINQWPYPVYTSKYHCLEVQASARNGTIDPASVRLVHRIRITAESTKSDAKKYVTLKINVEASAMLISCFFLLLTLVTYIALPQKRNLPGLMMMAFVTCLMITFLFRAIQVFSLRQLTKNWCTFVGLVQYYTLWCSFTWMNVMSYDVWSNACTMFQPPWRPRSRILVKLAWYAVYGFGVPMLMSAFMVGIDYADLTSMPNFIKPHFVAGTYCYFDNETERKLYINTPLIVATIINIFFFIMTAVYIWRNSTKPGGCGESRNTKKDKNRFAIYVKLGLITGVTWILDGLGAFISPELWVWMIADILNSLTGLFIFYTFVCKREILLQLCQRFEIKTSFARQWESTVVTSVSVSKRQLSDKELGPNEQRPELFAGKAAQ